MAFLASLSVHKRLVSWVGLVLLMAVFAVLAGCERSGPPASKSLSQQKADESVAVKEAEADVVLESEAVVETVKKAEQAEKTVSCTYDMQCSSYFRCIQGVCAVPPAITGVVDETTPVVVFRTDKARDSAEVSRFYVELAVSNLEQQRGLMYRRSMQSDWGMLFIYSYDEHHAFWMKNTLISLDMVFVNSDGMVVGVVEAAEPLTLDRREVDAVSRYILELNAGVAARSGIRKGVWMGFENIADEHAPGF